MHPATQTDDGGGDGSSSFSCFDYGVIGYGRERTSDEARVETPKEEHGVLVSGRCLGIGTIAMGGTGDIQLERREGLGRGCSLTSTSGRVYV